MGDFNINTSNITSPSTKNLKWFCIKNGFDQIRNRPTRSSLNSCAIIDLIVTNYSKAKLSKYGTIDINICDHNAIFFKRKVHPSRPVHKIITGRTYAQYKKDSFLKDLQNIGWQDIVAINQKIGYFTVYVSNLGFLNPASI